MRSLVVGWRLNILSLPLLGKFKITDHDLCYTDDMMMLFFPNSNAYKSYFTVLMDVQPFHEKDGTLVS